MFFCLFSCYRVQPLHLFIMCLTIGLISVVQWGPYCFPFIDSLMDCKTYWWANLLLISNLLPVHEIVSLTSNLDLHVALTFYFSILTCFLTFYFPISPSVFLGHGTCLLTSSVMPPLLCWSISTDCMSTSYVLPTTKWMSESWQTMNYI